MTWRLALCTTTALFAGLLAVAIDVVGLETPLLIEGYPHFGRIHLVRTALVAGSALLLVLGVSNGRAAESAPARAAASPQPQAAEGAPAVRRLVWVVLAVSALLLTVFLVDVRVFYQLAREDRPAEMLSALNALFAGALFVRIGLVMRRSRAFGRRLFPSVALILGIVFLLIGMEEISWFQRFLGVETPAAFESNEEQEINFHNFWTDEIENVYYFSAFAFFVVLPFVNDRTRIIEKLPLISFFTPSRNVLLASAVAFAYNFDMWDILATQLSFFVTLFILIDYLWRTRIVRDGRTMLVGLVAVQLLTQASFLIFGRDLVRIWDVTEYKELFIATSCLLYSIDTWRKTRVRIAS